MVLRITDKVSDAPNEYCLSMQDFASPEYHPFIAVNDWDIVYIDITPKTPLGIIRQMITTARVVPVLEDEVEVDPHMLSALCEVCPDEAAKLRYTYRSNKSDFYNLLKDLER